MLSNTVGYWVSTCRPVSRQSLAVFQLCDSKRSGNSRKSHRI